MLASEANRHLEGRDCSAIGSAEPTVDINPSAVERVVANQPFQSLGIVTDVEPFLRELADALCSAEKR